jgi:CheY-like chemotaxis protein
MSSAFDHRPSWSRVDLTGLTVLVVEDHPDSLEMLAAVLRFNGANVVPARTTRHAYEMLLQQLPHLVISDIGLPDEDGCSLMRRIRLLGTEQGGATPAIALSAYTQVEDRHNALAAGFHTYLTKPVDLDQLMTAILRLTPSPSE